ncbi:hypothetical protein swp_1071 [Shewanella piezotolerans WP3]|uniref:Uncharacterized protein n=1 Tax=Shewanella piezotolerans (strain WP3 / JCM 13877) TaxID=225849 RepID=B8CJB0_SHEPW|nr:hypothetical protein swp_1071 [Shewanella piezotolerans WP3]
MFHCIATEPASAFEQVVSWNAQAMLKCPVNR